MSENLPAPQDTRILIYQSGSGETRLEVRLQDETVWLTQRLMSELYQIGVNTINHHIKEILADGELAAAATIRQYRIVQTEGTRTIERQVEHYSLEMILAVGYRVRSHRGTVFRQWATARLKEYLLKGFVMDDERLKNPPGPGVPDYFDELLERIRDIRASEKRMYLRVRDIFALAADYQPDAAQTQQFFQIIQNKLHWAATGRTAAELIAERANHTQPNMGLTAWKGGKVRKTDVTIAKNYLREPEITELNRIVTMYLDYAEDQARRRKVLYMRDWRKKLDAFLQFNQREILTHAGRVEKAVADELAQDEYDNFHARRIAARARDDTQSFDDVVKKLPGRKPRKKA